jgi:hypothetical protein
LVFNLVFFLSFFGDYLLIFLGLGFSGLLRLGGRLGGLGL